MGVCVCFVMSLLMWWPNIGLLRGRYMLLGVSSIVVCLSPDVVGLIGDGGGDGVGILAGIAHCEFWRSGVVGGEGDGSIAEAIHDDWSLVLGEVMLSVWMLSAWVIQKSLP